MMVHKASLPTGRVLASLTVRPLISKIRTDCRAM